jgi:hypothetical protein
MLFKARYEKHVTALQRVILQIGAFDLILSADGKHIQTETAAKAE